METINQIKFEELAEYLGVLESPDGFLFASENKFNRLFGRDSIIASLQLLPWNPDYAKNTLKILASLQKEDGQILHETFQENTMWDSLDSTPLFIILVVEYFKRTNDRDFLNQLLPHVEKAHDWIKKYGDKDKDGFLEYQENENGLTHHCWKDSKDGISFEDSSIPEHPIAPVEVQGYYYKSLAELAELSLLLGDTKRARDHLIRAEKLKEKFNKSFWMKKEKFFALALDKNKKQVKVISSNIGHAIWTGIIKSEYVEPIVSRLLEEDILTPFGLRTLSDKMGNYYPDSYHLGSIWPFDNWFFAEALDKYWYHAEAQNVRRTVLKGLSNLGKPYECYAYSNDELYIKLQTHEGGELYPEEVQAWTLGAMYSFLQKLREPIGEIVN